MYAQIIALVGLIAQASAATNKPQLLNTVGSLLEDALRHGQ